MIQQCAANDRRSQEKLYLSYYSTLFALCRKFFTDEHEALEVLNDGMLKVFMYIHTYNNAKGDFFNWMYTIVRNTALDKLKVKKLPPAGELHDEMDTGFADNPILSMEWKDIYRLLDALSPATRAVCTLFYLESFTIKDISTQLEISEGTVKWHLSETRRKLKPVFKTHYL